MIDNQQRMATMEKLLREYFSPTALKISDQSAQHQGHSGAKDGRGHFTLYIVADKFNQLSLIQRHKMVYKVLSDMLRTDIHALSINAKAPQELAT